MPEQPLGRAIEGAHDLVLIDHRDRIDGRVEDRAVQRIGLAAAVNAVRHVPTGRAKSATAASRQRLNLATPTPHPKAPMR